MKISFIFLAMSTWAVAQNAPDSLGHLTHSATLVFVQRDGACISGSLAKADAKTVTIKPVNGPQVTLNRDDFIQVSHGNALLYSGRSSWQDVAQAPMLTREAFLLTLKDGRRMQGKPIHVDAHGILLKHGYVKTMFAKSDIKTVDYLRLKPESDGYGFLLQESPYLAFFDPEFYYRAMGLQGRVAVRLYDVFQRQDEVASPIKSCP